MTTLSTTRPIIGITTDAVRKSYLVNRSYAEAIEQAGGVPVLLPCAEECVAEYLALCSGIVFIGGDDPNMTQWGIPMHPQARSIDPARQSFELSLLRALDDDPDKPVLGICLGMQLMGLHAGGSLNQYLPDTLSTADLHWKKRRHEVTGEFGEGVVYSHHRQALCDPGSLRVVATAPDGVIEAIRDDHRPCYLGVQWHAERTRDPRLGSGLFRLLVEAAAGRPTKTGTPIPRSATAGSACKVST